jgi:crotonobetainyl-CoA:carnitine CoA-transferase CaiB-like acyl-CoA transferase
VLPDIVDRGTIALALAEPVPDLRMEGSSMEQALSDVRVIDLTHYLAGPYCTKLLADYGADVIKVEKPGEGDGARRLGPFFEDDPHPEKSGLFLDLNTNKRSITLNLKTRTGKRIFMDLAKDADIVVESFEPRVMTGLGLDYESLEKINPRLVMTSISNFGQTGPYRDYKASEPIIYGVGGAMFTNGMPDREPLKLGGTVVLFQGGLMAAGATLGAFYGSRYQGIGQHVDVALTETQAGSVDMRGAELIAYQYCGEVSRRTPPDIFGIQFPPSVSPCADGYFNLVTGYVYWHRFAEVMEIPELKEAKFSPRPDMDVATKEEFDSIFIPWSMERTKREISDLLSKGGLLVEPLNAAADLLADPHLKERDYFVEIDHPVTGKLKHPGLPFKMAASPGQISRPAPLLGQHNDEVYEGLGYTREDLVRLRERGVI